MIRELCFVDLETGGLEPETDAVLDVAFVRTTITGEVLARFGTRLKPLPGARITPKAAEVNGYSAEAWATAKNLWFVLPELVKLSAGCMVAGHNVGFDRGFLRVLERRMGVNWGWGDYHAVDTMAMAMPLYVRGEVERVSLGVLCSHFGIVNQAAHSAMGDCLASIELYRRLIAGAAP